MKLEIKDNKLYTETGKELGDIVMSDDGYYNFIPICSRGLYNTYSLKLIADKLDEINKPWDDQINSYFDNQIKL
jgi:hypothetical protein